MILLLFRKGLENGQNSGNFEMDPGIALKLYSFVIFQGSGPPCPPSGSAHGNFIDIFSRMLSIAVVVV